MMKNYHNSKCGRVAVTLLLTIGVLGFWALSAQAETETECAAAWENPLAKEIHTLPPGMDKSMCPPPVPDFCACPNEGCDSLKVCFIDYSTGVIDLWEWDFGDPASGADNFSNEENPIHWYRSPGTYTVSLTVTGPGGTATETKYHIVVIETAPTADFVSRPRAGCSPFRTKFDDQSSANTDSWLWDFGDGQTSTDQNPTHTYTRPGKYTVSLIATNECGPDVKTRVEYITVFGGPSADFSATPRSGRVPLTVNFTDLSTSEVGLTNWSWEFGDGTAASAQNPTHIYTDTGTYTVSLKVVDPCGEDTEIKEEYIHVTDCSLDFVGFPTSGCAALDVVFTGLPSGDCDVSSWTWNFGDPASGSDNTDTGLIVLHRYQSRGIYTVTLSVAEAGGTQVVTKTDYITVYGGPTADFAASRTSGAPPLTVDFTDLSTSDVGIDTWWWEFGDGGTSSDRDPTHVYTDTGTFFVSLTVADSCGKDTHLDTIDIGPLLSIDKEVDKDHAIAWQTLEYTVTIRNESPAVLRNITVTDTVPDLTEYLQSDGTYDQANGLVTWDIDSLDIDAEKTLSLEVFLAGPYPPLPDSTIVSNFAIAAVDDGITIAAALLTYVSDTVTTIVVSDTVTGELSVNKDVSDTLALPRDTLTYYIVVANEEQVFVNNVIVRDAVPDSTTFLDIFHGGVWDPVTDSMTWNLGSFSPFEVDTVSFQVTINPGVADGHRIPNRVFVSWDGGSVMDSAWTDVGLERLTVRKSVSSPSGMFGDLVRYTISVENYTGELLTDVHLIDTMPAGIFYVSGTSLLDGDNHGDPTGDMPLEWLLNPMPPGDIVTLEYTGLISTSARFGINENVARAWAIENAQRVESNRAIAQVYVLGYVLTGSIRGKVIVDCDGDGIPDTDSVPSGVDVYLDDGGQSRVNEKGMFYFSTVRPGERVVALDERDLDGYFVPEDAQASVFVHVHESGESYVIFRVCPEYPQLDIRKSAAIVPTVKVTKKAQLNPEQVADILGVMIDYEVDIKSNGLADPTQVRIVDSFPDNMHLMLAEQQTLAPKRDGTRLVYEVTAAQERLQKSVFYSLQDLSPGVRRFLTNKVHLEGDLALAGDEIRSITSEPAEVAVGPFLLAPARDVQVTLTPALFITSKAFLQPPAIPQLEAVADSIMKYADANIKVEGHCDFRRIHTVQFPSNWELGEARAKAVVDWLVENRGIDRNRLEYESFAATRPVVTDVPTTSEALQPNRRTEVIIKTRVAGFMAPSEAQADKWESSTSMALNPVKFDTLFEPAPTPMEIDLDDSWEILVTVENTGAIAAENTTLTDILPDGVEYIENSATVDGSSIAASTAGNKLNLVLARIEPSQVIEVRYRVRALPGATPSGGGAASVELMTPNNLPVVQTSNEVRFE